MVVSLPSLTIDILLGLLKDPIPLKYEILFFLNKNSTPLVKVVTALSLFSIIFERFSFISPVSIPIFLKFFAL